MEVYRKPAPKVKKVSGRPPLYADEYMVMIAKKVVEEGMTYREASKTFGVSSGSIGTWVRRVKRKEYHSVGGKEVPSSELRMYRMEEQLSDLKKEIGELYLENLMLKKALSHSVQIKKENSSIITPENLAQFQKAAK